MVSTREQIIKNLVLPALKALAASPEVQMQIYPPFCCPLEELLADAEHALGSLLSMYPETLSAEQTQAMKATLTQIAKMVGADAMCHGVAGDFEQLGNQNWCTLRSLAGNTIKKLGYEIQLPIPAQQISRGGWAGPS